MGGFSFFALPGGPHMKAVRGDVIFLLIASKQGTR